MRQRNLIILLAHGLRSDALADSQAWPLSTPHFDQLSARSLRVVASAASPADPGGMLSLLTGLHARQHGHTTQSDQPVKCDGFVAWLKDAGYHVRGAGCVAPIEDWLDDCVMVEDVDQTEPVGCSYLTNAVGKGLRPAIQQQRRQRLRTGPFEPDRLLLEPLAMHHSQALASWDASTALKVGDVPLHDVVYPRPAFDDVTFDIRQTMSRPPKR